MKRITAIGEILFDVYPQGEKLGGAPFNFIYHIIKLTGAGNFVSRIGNDDLGNKIIKILEQRNISIGYLQRDKFYKTGIAKTTLSDQKVPDFIIEENRAYDFIEKSSIVNNLVEKETECLYFGTLSQRNEISRNTIQSFFGKNIKYFCDLNIRQKFYSKNLIKNCLVAANVLKLNESELQLVNELLINSKFNFETISKKIIDKFNIELLCVTRGNEGAILFNNRNEKHSFKMKSEKIVDTVGAGDAYASILCIGYLKNWKLEKINKLATEFANEIIKIDGALPNNNEIYNLFEKKIKNGNRQ